MMHRYTLLIALPPLLAVLMVPASCHTVQSHKPFVDNTLSESGADAVGAAATHDGSFEAVLGLLRLAEQAMALLSSDEHGTQPPHDHKPQPSHEDPPQPSHEEPPNHVFHLRQLVDTAVRSQDFKKQEDNSAVGDARPSHDDARPSHDDVQPSHDDVQPSHDPRSEVFRHNQQLIDNALRSQNFEKPEDNSGADDPQNHIFHLQQLVDNAFWSQNFKKHEDYDFHEILDLVENAFYKPTGPNNDNEDPVITQSREHAFGHIRHNLQKYLNKLLYDEENTESVQEENSLEIVKALKDKVRHMKY